MRQIYFKIQQIWQINKYIAGLIITYPVKFFHENKNEYGKSVIINMSDSG
jgi:hypothetical protein